MRDLLKEFNDILVMFVDNHRVLQSFNQYTSSAAYLKLILRSESIKGLDHWQLQQLHADQNNAKEVNLANWRSALLPFDELRTALDEAIDQSLRDLFHTAEFSGQLISEIKLLNENPDIIFHNPEVKLPEYILHGSRTTATSVLEPNQLILAKGWRLADGTKATHVSIDVNNPGSIRVAFTLMLEISHNATLTQYEVRTRE